MNFLLPIYILAHFPPPHAGRRRGVHAAARGRVTEAGKFLILPFTGEISYRCFTGCQKYFWGPVESPYANSPVKVYSADHSPPQVEFKLSMLERQEAETLAAAKHFDEEAINAPFLFFTGDISHLGFTGSRKYFMRLPS